MSDAQRLRALLVFEPAVAQAAQRVAHGLASGGALVRVGTVATVDPAAASRCDLLLVGATTTSYSASYSAGRGATSFDTAPSGSIAGWLSALRPRRDTAVRADGRLGDRAASPAYAAAFDTRFGTHRRHQWVASTRASWRLSRLGYELAGLPMGFRLDAVDEELARGEAERAEAWACGVAMTTAQRTHWGPAASDLVSAAGPTTPPPSPVACPA